jgi:hypothetical protein
MGDFSYFERGQTVSERLAGTTVIITDTLLSVPRATVSKVMSVHTNHGKTSAKRYNRRKSTLTERDRRTLRAVLKNHRNAA